MLELISTLWTGMDLVDFRHGAVFALIILLIAEYLLLLFSVQSRSGHLAFSVGMMSVVAALELTHSSGLTL